MVEEELYRCGQPNELNFPFIERLGLRTIVFLAPEEASTKLYAPMAGILFRCLCRLAFVEDQEIRLHHLSGLSTNAFDPISENVVLEALEIIMDPSKFPLMVMCNLGRHRTGKSCGVF